MLGGGELLIFRLFRGFSINDFVYRGCVIRFYKIGKKYGNIFVFCKFRYGFYGFYYWGYNKEVYFFYF